MTIAYIFADLLLNDIRIAIGAKIMTPRHTSFIVGELISQLHTVSHQFYNFNCRGIHLCNACVSLVSACLACMISERQLHNNYARGIYIQLHAHQLHINNCWGIINNRVIIPAPMVNMLEAPAPGTAIADSGLLCLLGRHVCRTKLFLLAKKNKLKSMRMENTTTRSDILKELKG